MNREIKFRGWTDQKNSKKVIGCLRRFGGEINLSFIWDENCHSHRVKPETVGQYTGLIGEGGEVYEGDIVECYGEDDKLILKAEVQFQEGCFCVQIDYDLQLIPLDSFGNAYKVIGNIHENPELLNA